MEPDLIRRVSERYDAVSARMYARGKLGSDPIATQLVELGRDQNLGEVVDVGCGRGQMAILLLEAGVATRVTGSDWDEGKLADARMAAEGRVAQRSVPSEAGGAGGESPRQVRLPATFEKADVREFSPPPCDTLLLIDVLHYLTDKQQLEVLERCMQSARTRVVIRELDPDRGWRSATTKVQEAVTTFFGYNVGERVRVLPISAFSEVLERGGFSVRVEPSWGSTPFANVMIIATR